MAGIDQAPLLEELMAWPIDDGALLMSTISLGVTSALLLAALVPASMRKREESGKTWNFSLNRLPLSVLGLIIAWASLLLVALGITIEVSKINVRLRLRKMLENRVFLMIKSGHY